ncbi:M23 family metallopeptidase (plasmid) [Oscillospiraceae bacterium PP1C4]
MSDFELKSRDKQIDQMTKDGLVRKNVSTGAVQRVSKREKDTAFVESEEHTNIGRKNQGLETNQQIRPRPFIRQTAVNDSQEDESTHTNRPHRLHFEKRNRWRTEKTYSRLRFSAAELAAERIRDSNSDGKFEESVETSNTFSRGTRRYSRLRFTSAENAKENIKAITNNTYRAGRWGIKKSATALKETAHNKIREYEDDNSGVKAAHVLEEKAEGYVANYVKHFRKERIKKKVRDQLKGTNNQYRENRSYINSQKQENTSTGKKSSKSRILQKKRIKRTQIKSFQDAAKKTGQVAIALYNNVKKKALQFFIKNSGWIIGALLIYFAMMFLMVGISSCAQGLTSQIAVIISSYLAENQDIHNSSVLVTQLEAELDKQIADIPTDSKWSYIDEFRYNLDPIGHDPFVFMAWMTTKFDDFKFSEQENFARELHNARYDLQFDEEIEVRERTYEDEDGDEHTEEYNWYILNVTLTSKTIEEIIEPEMELDESGELKDRFEVLMETKGARQIVANPFDIDWTGSYSSIYGYRLDPLEGDGLQFHRGLDVPMPTGTPIRAGVTGTVLETGYNDTYGNFIVIKDKKGETQVKYAHCDQLKLSAGAEITAGETIIATVGNTGGSTGEHLHIEVKENGEYVNPIYAVDWEPKIEE